MAATDFPQAPTVGEEFTGLGGITYVWDGVKWTNGICGGSVSNALDSIIAGQCIGLVNTPGPPQTLTINALIPCIQTPWLQNINGGMFQLSNAVGIGIAGAAPAAGMRVYSGGIGINAPAPNLPQIVITGRAADVVPGVFVTTTNPSAQPIIALSNDIRQSSIIYYGSATANPGAFSFECAGGADYIRFYTSGGTAGERMRITATGQVGIGTASPNATLHVVGAEALWSGSASANCTFFFGRTATDGTIAVAYAANQFASGSAAGDIILRSEAQSVILGSTGQGTLYVTATSRVGINNPLPTAMLHGIEAANIDPNLTYGGPAGYNFNSAGIDLAMATSSQPPYPYWIQARLNNNTGANLSLNPLGGLVGVGTPVPQGIFHVYGNVMTGSSIYMYYTGNVGNSYPVYGSANFALGWNFTGGSGEVDFFNITANGGFRWYQQTSASSATYLCGVDNTGNFFADRFEAASAYFGPTTTLSCPMLFCNNADPSAGMAVQTICIWADQANSRLVIDFKNSLGGVYRGYIPVA